MSVYTLNLRVFWPLFTCVLTGLVVLHHIAHRLSPEPDPDPGYEGGAEGCNDQGPPVLLSLAKLILAFALCYLFIRYCSAPPGGAGRGVPEVAELHPKSSSSRRELLEDYYERWVRVSPHVVGHSKANVAKLVGDLVRAGRADAPPESSLAFRGDFIQVGSAYEEHKVGPPDCFDILVPLRLPRGLRAEPRVVWREEGRREADKEEKRESKGEERRESKGEGRRESKGKVKGEDKRGTSKKGKKEEGSGKEGKGEGKKEEGSGKEGKGDGKKEEGSAKEGKEEGKKEERSGKEGKGEGKEEAVGEKRGEEEQGGRGAVPRCSLETPRRDEWLRRHRAFADAFLRLHPRGAESGGGAYRLTPESVLRWFHLAVQRCLATVRYPYERRCALSLTLADGRLQLRLAPRSDYVCCHISMAIRLLPALPLGDGLYLVPVETAAPPAEAKDLWTPFFPRQEQRLMGWLRGRVPQGSCHLKCLQLVKAVRDLGGGALDGRGGALWRSVLSSYALKTAWLRLLLGTRPEAWEERHLVARVEDLLRALRDGLQERSLQHLFLGGGARSASLLPDSVVLPRLVKEAGGGAGEGGGGNLWAEVPPGALELVSGRLAYAWSHLHRLIRLGRPQRSALGLGRAGHGHCQHLEAN